MFEDVGAWSVFLGLAPENEAEAVSAIDEELDRIRKEPPPSDELRRTKDYIEGTFRLGLESPRSKLFYIGPSILGYGRIVPVQEAVENIEAVTAGDISALAEQILDDGLKSVSRVVSKDL